MPSDSPSLSSESHFRGGGFDAFLRRGSILAQGFETEEFVGRPFIGIVSNWSELSRCHGHFRELADSVKRGVWQAGGFPREIPTMPVAADLAIPTGISFMHRNLLAMEIEEICRTYPIDGLVLIGSCDETIPAMLMAAASVNLPSIVLPGGPGINGRWRGCTVGSSTDCHRIFADIRAGQVSQEEELELSASIDRSYGHCTTMGTASTMACLAESLGLAFPGSAAIPAVDSRRRALAQRVGRQIVSMTEAGGPLPRDMLSDKAFYNAVTVLGSIAGSTNAIMHLLALARRCNVSLTLKDIDLVLREVPTLVDVKPTGSALMEDFFFAGGIPALLGRLKDSLHGDALTVSGQTIQQIADNSGVSDDRVIRPLDDPVYPGGALVALFGNLAPDGAVLKTSSASPGLLTHTGRAHVFESRQDLDSRIDDPVNDIQPEDVLILRNAGPKGAPGMPEWGTIPIPARLLRKGIRDMVRISDSRMSGTAFGTVILHVSPEAVVGGPLALVENGDHVALDVPRRRLDLQVSAEELAVRKSRYVPPRTRELTGYPLLFSRYVTQANEGCDFDFSRHEGC